MFFEVTFPELNMYPISSNIPTYYRDYVFMIPLPSREKSETEMDSKYFLFVSLTHNCHAALLNHNILKLKIVVQSHSYNIGVPMNCHGEILGQHGLN